MTPRRALSLNESNKMTQASTTRLDNRHKGVDKNRLCDVIADQD